MATKLIGISGDGGTSVFTESGKTTGRPATVTVSAFSSAQTDGYCNCGSVDTDGDTVCDLDVGADWGPGAAGYAVMINPNDYRMDRVVQVLWAGATKPAAGASFQSTALAYPAGAANLAASRCKEGGVVYTRFFCEV